MLRFYVTGVEVAVIPRNEDAIAALPGFYEHYPSSGRPPDLVIEIEKIANFADGRVRGTQYPAFRRGHTGPNTISLSRFDAEGEITLPMTGDHACHFTGMAPVSARFRVGDSRNSLEAIIRICMSVTLPRRGGLLMHSSAIATGDKAYVFAGASGAGKSTIATLLHTQCPQANKISDELLILAPYNLTHDGDESGDQSQWFAHVSPFIGSDGLPHRTRVPVAAIHFLWQAPHHHRVAIPRSRALRELLKHVLVYVAEPTTADLVLAAGARLCAAVPCYDLHFAPHPSIVEVIGIT